MTHQPALFLKKEWKDIAVEYCVMETVGEFDFTMPKHAIYLIADDSFLESFLLPLNYAVINPANTKAWKESRNAIIRLYFWEFNRDNYEKMIVFIDCNHIFSIYTQIALFSSNKIVIIMAADFSCLEEIQGILILIVG